MAFYDFLLYLIPVSESSINNLYPQTKVKTKVEKVKDYKTAPAGFPF